MTRPWRRVFAVVRHTLLVLSLAGLLADKAFAAPRAGQDAPAPAHGQRLVSRSVVDLGPALEKPTFLRTLLVQGVCGPALDYPPEESCRPDPRTTIERDGRLIAVAVLTKYLHFQESLSSP